MSAWWVDWAAGAIDGGRLPVPRELICSRRQASAGVSVSAYNPAMRKFILLLILFLAVLFVFLSFSELQSIAETLQKSNLIFLTFAVLFQCLWLYNAATTYGSLYRLVELEETKRQLFLMTTAANFVNVIAPSAGIGGMAVFLDVARRRGQPTGRVTVAGVLFALYDYAAFLCVLSLGLTVLFRRNHLTASELTASAILLVIA